MIQPAPADATCPQHPHRAAAWICGRCGSFFCAECERRTRPDAVPMCPGCWDKRLEKVGDLKPDEPGTGLQTAALVLGVAGILPIPVVQIGALVVAILALLKAKTPEQKKARWRPIVGLVCLALGMVVWVLIALAAIKD